MTGAAIQERVARDLYGLLTGDEDARVCKDIPDAACNDQPRNYVLQLASLSATSIGDELSNPKIILPWLMNALGAPAFLLGWLVPVRESLSLLPQLFVAAYVRRAPVRKWFWVGGSIAQAIAVLAMAAVALTLSGAAAGWSLVGLLVVFSLSRGVCSVASKDVLGKTVSKTRRGSLSGYATSVAGLAAFGAGIYALASQDASRDLGFFVTLLVLAGGLWLAGAGLYSLLAEQPGATAGGGNAARTALENLSAIGSDWRLRRFLITRALLVSTALAAPFYVALAHGASGGGIGALGLLIIAQGLAATLSAGVWGRFSDRSSRLVMAAAGLGAGLLGLIVVSLVAGGWRASESSYFFAAAVFALGVAHAGARVGRKTYLVDMATADNRAAYVAVSNSLIGIVLLAGGSLGAIAQSMGPAAVIVVLAVLSLAAAVSAWTLDEA